MGVFDKFADAPDQIRREGQEITIRFQRTGPTTGRITWNIPPPAAGCNGNAAYDGIVITVSGKAVNYLTNSPKDGTYYTSDATGDADLHGGDKLDGSLVVAALYHDRTTTSIEVNDILPKTPYYVSGYAVDSVGRYHREGVHAYSLPTGEAEGSLPDIAAKHDIIIDVVGGIDLSALTGLMAGTEYTLLVKIDGKEYTILVDGENVTHYSDLVAELKEKLSLLGEVYSSPLPPYSNALYYNSVNETLQMWDGDSLVDVPVLSHSADPTMQELNALWYDTTAKLLKMHNGTTWVVKPFISTPHNPLTLACDQAWFDGTHVWVYKLTHWEKLYTYNQTRNPLLAPLLTCDDYWYNTATGVVTVWDVDSQRWVPVDAIYMEENPNTLGDGDYWYDETAKQVKLYASSVWGVVADVEYVTALPVDEDDYTAAANGHNFLYASSTNELYELVANVWTLREIVAFPTDPTDRTKSKLWWNSSIGVDTLFAWDAIASVWVNVSSFTQGTVDPSLPVAVEPNSAWYNPETTEIKLVFKTACKTIYPIIFAGTPGQLPNNTVWFDSDNNMWYLWDGTVFTEVEPMYYPTDPYIVTTGYYWFDETDELLKRWSGTTWVTTDYEVKPISVEIGMFWFNTVSDILYVWDGRAWIESDGLASVRLIPAENSKDRSVLSFYTRGIGCGSTIEVMMESGHLLSFLTQPIMVTDPIAGVSGLVGGALYKQLGVGDDGSPDERRAMHDFIRNALGYPVVQVELTKEQLDQCINLALATLRKGSSYAGRRGVFFLDMMPNQQTYLLTNKCVGFNKVTGINAIHRHRGLAMGAGAAGNDTFTYAAIQRLYTMGTFDMLSFHLVSAYMEELETLFANRIMWNWKELERELSLYSRVWKKERVLVDAWFERTEQDLMIDRQTATWLSEWALAEAKMILSQSRGKFQTLPGPNGSTTLNAQDIQAQADESKKQLREQLEDGSMQDLNAVGLRGHLILG